MDQLIFSGLSKGPKTHGILYQSVGRLDMEEWIAEPSLFSDFDLDFDLSLPEDDFTLDYEKYQKGGHFLFLTRLAENPICPQVLSGLLLLEAELFMSVNQYEMALTLTEGAAQKCEDPQSLRGLLSLKTDVQRLICTYQLGDRGRAMALKESLEIRMAGTRFNQTYPDLYKTYQGTCDVLEFLPRFLEMCAAQTG